MAQIIPQQPHESEIAKQGAQASTSVPELRDNVAINSDAIQRLEALVVKLRRQLRTSEEP